MTRAVEPVRWLVVAGIAWTLATTALYIASGPEASAPTRPAAASGERPREPVNVNAILARNLFGQADAAPREVATETAVETRLPLELQGVFVADEVADESAAIIAQKGKPGLRYVIGEKIPGNAELVAVFADHVILRRAGTREKLTFPTATSQFRADPNVPAAPPPASRASSAPAPQTAREFVSTYQERMEADPQGTLDELGITPVSDDTASGYRLGDLAQSPYLSQTGLQPGDVVLSVNGRAIGNLDQDRLEIANVLAQGSARLEVQRGTRRFFVTASLK